MPGARSEQTGGRFYRMTRDQVLDCVLESASQRRGRGPEYEGHQETKAFGECAQVGVGGLGCRGLGPGWSSRQHQILGGLVNGAEELVICF